MSALLALWLAVPAAADLTPPPSAEGAPAASTETAAAPAASTETAAAVATSTGGVHAAGAAKPAKVSRPMHATIHPEAKEWEPLALKAAGDPGQAQTRVETLLEKAKGKYKGRRAPATASARLHKQGDDLWLVVSVFPRSLGGLIDRRRPHFEVRFRIMEGYVEDVKAALVTLAERAPRAAAGLDAWELRARGVAFEEDSPGSGTVLVSALDPRPSKSAFNAGVLKLAAFESHDVRLADVAWSAKGLPAAR